MGIMGLRPVLGIGANGIVGTTTTASIDQIPVWNCHPNGYLAGGPWTFLGMDIQFGRMSFAQAKTLDMAWNWVAGRGL